MSPGPVRARQVFYIPGFDPSPPRRYREMYRSEAALQARIAGYRLDLTARPPGAGYGWGSRAEIGGLQTDARFEVLVWSDIVRQSMRQGIVATYWQMARVVWVYVASGALVRLLRLRKGPMIAALYPILFLLIELLVAVVAGWGVARLAGDGLAGLGLPHGLALASAVAALGATVWGVLLAFRKLDRGLYAWYLIHDYAFTAGLGGANPPALDKRLSDFADRIAAALDGPYDEVLLVGHSSGVHLAVSVLADLIRSGRVTAPHPALALMSLGQVVPMVSFLPKAHRLRADLAFLSERPELCWVDVTAPGDGCAFALCDPVAVSGMAGPAKRWPLVISAAFTQTLTPERWRKLRWRFLKLHFQYLCAFDRPGIYDYFSITAGPVSLAERFMLREPSKTRIETPLNPYGARPYGSRR